MASKRLLLLLTFLAMPSIAYAEACALTRDALRLIIVTAPSMETQNAKLQLFQRSNPADPWQALGSPEAVVIGKAGLGWGFTFLEFKRGEEPEKIEGDKRSPAGIFRVGPAFGFSKGDTPGFIHVVPEETVCVEDPASAYYNKITTRSAIEPDIKVDVMASNSRYRNGLFIDYPSERSSRRGSCIFIHIWADPEQGTSGCVALPEERVRAIQDFAAQGAVIAILPEHALNRFRTCLPRQASD